MYNYKPADCFWTYFWSTSQVWYQSNRRLQYNYQLFTINCQLL